MGAETRIIEAQPGPQTAFLGCPADIAIYGGSAGGGKSWALLLDPLRHCGNGEFGGVVFRRTTVQIRNEGGLWDESEKLYPLAHGAPREHVLQWNWPSGATISFAHLEHDKNVLDWQGSQIPFMGFDELTHFTEKQFWYMLSRNRSMCGVRPYVRATCNPDADSWVAELIAWWIDQESGLPIPERAGVLRWFVRINDGLVWADTADELRAIYPAIEPKSLTFIPAKLTDNAKLMAADPGYMANLMALSIVDRERLLGGNWKVRPISGLYFRKEWFEVVEEIPQTRGQTTVRTWDFAATEESEGGDPDWTVSMKVVRVPDADDSRSATFYVTDVDRFRASPGKVRDRLVSTANQDGRLVPIRGPQDPGQAGKSQAAAFVRALAGYTAKFLPVTGSKEVRAKPASVQAEARNIKLVRGAWNTLFLDETEAFPLGAHDDQVDALADAIDELSSGVTGLVTHVETAPRTDVTMWANDDATPARSGGMMWG